MKCSTGRSRGKVQRWEREQMVEAVVKGKGSIKVEENSEVEEITDVSGGKCR